MIHNNNSFSDDLLNNVNILLHNHYDKIMVLKLFVDSDDENLKNTYLNAAHTHNNKIIQNQQHIDAGFDLYAPGNEGEELEYYGNHLRFFGPGREDKSPINKLDMKVSCSAQIFTDNGKCFNTGYYMYPRSSISKTKLRLANGTGIIDSGYRGHLIGMFDVVDMVELGVNEYIVESHDRLLQICAPGLVPIVVQIVDSMEELGNETERGAGGLGSSGR